jgi:hypothetical protein
MSVAAPVEYRPVTVGADVHLPGKGSDIEGTSRVPTEGLLKFGCDQIAEGFGVRLVNVKEFAREGDTSVVVPVTDDSGYVFGGVMVGFMIEQKGIIGVVDVVLFAALESPVDQAFDALLDLLGCFGIFERVFSSGCVFGQAPENTGLGERFALQVFEQRDVRISDDS